MRYIYLLFFLLFYSVAGAQVSVVNQKGTRVTIDSSKWTSAGSNIYNKNAGNTGIGRTNPSYKLDVNGTARVSDSLLAGTVRIATLPQGSATDSMVVADPVTGLLKQVTPRAKTVIQKTVAVQTNTSATLTTVSGLSFTPQAGSSYRVKLWLVYDAAMTLLMGIRLGPNFAGTGNYWYHIEVNNTSTSSQEMTAFNTNTTLSSSGSRATTGNVALITMNLECVSSGLLSFQFATTLAGSAISIQPNSMLEYEEIDL